MLQLSKSRALTIALCMLPFLIFVVYQCNYGDSESKQECIVQSPEDTEAGVNTLVVYAGRWKFLRILFPYIYRELRQNGGVLDRVRFIMMKYDKETLTNLVQLTQIANKQFNQPEEIFQLDFSGFPPEKRFSSNHTSHLGYNTPYYKIFAEMITEKF